MMPFIRFLLATFHLQQKAVCELSAPLGTNDFHRYYDEDEMAPHPWHMYTYHCRFCGKAFTE